MTEPERLSRPACIAATRELLRALPASCTGGGESAERLQHHCAQRAQEALLVLSRGAGRSLGFGVDTVRDLDRLLAGHFVLNEMSPGQVLDLGLIFAEILRRNFGGRYLWLADRDTLGLKIEALTAMPVDKVIQSLELQKPATLEGYLFILAKRQSTVSRGPVPRLGAGSDHPAEGPTEAGPTSLVAGPEGTE